MEKEQRKNLEQALAKVITDWVDFLGEDAGQKLEKAIKSASRDLMKKWSKIEKKAADQEQHEEVAGASVEVLSLPVPSSLKTAARKASRETTKKVAKKAAGRPATKAKAPKKKAGTKAVAKNKSVRSVKSVTKK